MIEKERQVLIMDQLRETGFVSVRDLMDLLGASRSSIMRDLAALERQGLLVREHGGAAMPEISQTLSRRNEPAVAAKVNTHVREKRAVALRAAETVREGSCIFVDSGTTTPYLLSALRNREVTIVTASVYLLSRMPEELSGRVCLLGGQYDAKYQMNRGEYAMSMLEMFHIDTGFFSANGVDLKSGDVTVADFGLACAKKHAMKQCARSVLLIDETKIGTFAQCRYAGLKDFDRVYVSGARRKEYPNNFRTVKGEEK